MSRLRTVFMGSPEFAVPSLEALLRHTDVQLVVTQPDQPAGRGRQLQPTAVRQAAEAAGVPVATPPSLRKPPYAPTLAELNLDLIVVVAYGKILPADVLAVPRHGCWNVHGSILPRYRGAAPIQWALLSGERETGVTLMQMDVGLDTGPMLLTRTLPITEDDTAGSLHTKLAPLGAEALVEGLERLAAGTLVATPQDNAAATLAPLLEKEAGRVDWTQPAEVISCRIRGVDPWPGAFTTLEGEVLKLWRPHVVPSPDGEAKAPGTVLGQDGQGLVVACGRGAVAVGELQLPGRKRLGATALLAGRSIPAGTVLGR
ncbi:MAG TPA: methionyl-tRNA formyltransferase [Polyangia bacterium]|jgi:methionyl-tRNA formyltransferase|nr:methionyl-tRNA formyltransferase [Polyangia bacterium]